MLALKQGRILEQHSVVPKSSQSVARIPPLYRLCLLQVRSLLTVALSRMDFRGFTTTLLEVGGCGHLCGFSVADASHESAQEVGGTLHSRLLTATCCLRAHPDAPQPSQPPPLLRCLAVHRRAPTRACATRPQG